MAVRFVLNGAPIEVGDVEPHVSLLQWLRSSGLTGTKEGCAEGECGACAVAMLRLDDGRVRYESINSCLLPLQAAHGHSLITSEGVAEADGTLHPVQRALADAGASQCGFCTPGFVISLFCEYYRPGRQAYDAEAISGNLCRCTGYRPIRDAARTLPQPAADDPRLQTLVEAPGTKHVGDVFSRMAAAPTSTLLAGGTDLMVYANQRHTRFEAFLSLDAVPELQRFEHSDEELVLGAGLSLTTVERKLREASIVVPILDQLWPLFSSRLIRNRATLGGNLATASPIGDSAPALLALDAELSLLSRDGERRVPLRDFFRGYRQTILAAGELIASVHVRLPTPHVQRFYKVSKRMHDDISTVAAAYALELDRQGRVSAFRLAYGGVAAVPLRAAECERLALGRAWNRETLAVLRASLTALGTPQDDLRGSAAYRRAMIGSLLDKFYDDSTRALAEAP